MDIRDRRALKASAVETLQKPSGDPKRLILLYTGIYAAFALAVALISHVLRQQISGTGGLGGVGARTALQTGQQVLSLLASYLPVFWSMGYVYTMLRLSRNQPVRDGDLLQGFRKFGPVLRLSLLQSILITIAATVAISAGSTLLSFTPLAAPAYEALLPLMTAAETAAQITVPDEATMAAITDAMMPLLLGSCVLALILLLPLLYRLRLSTYFLMDDPEYGALSAMIRSGRAMRGHRLQLAALDLSFWWYYLLEALTLLISYGTLVLPLLGIALPLPEDTAYLVCYAISVAGQAVLYILARNKVSLTYTKAYEVLRLKPEMPVSSPKPTGKLPWEEPPTQAQ